MPTDSQTPGSAVMAVTSPSRILFIKEHKRLDLTRGKIPLWKLPGGKIGPRERPIQAAWRELIQETGLRVSVESVFPVAESWTTEEGKHVPHLFQVNVSEEQIDSCPLITVENGNDIWALAFLKNYLPRNFLERHALYFPLLNLKPTGT